MTPDEYMARERAKLADVTKLVEEGVTAGAWKLADGRWVRWCVVEDINAPWGSRERIEA